MLDLQKLRTFQVVAEASSFTRAAAELHYSQSTVTCHVQALEKELGVTLLDRTSQRVTLTEAGRQALKYAGQVLALTSEVKAAVQRLGGVRGSLSVSAPEALMTYRLPEVLREFQELYPQVQLALSTHSNSNAQIQALLDSELDLVFAVGETMRSDRLTAKFLSSEEIVIVATPEYRPIRSQELTPDVLAEERILLTDRSCSFRQLFERVTGAAGVELRHTLELSSIEAIKQCVLAGMGLAVVPKMAVLTELLQKRVVALRWPHGDLRAQVQILRHRKRPVSPAARAFWSLAEHAFSNDPEPSDPGLLRPTLVL